MGNEKVNYLYSQKIRSVENPKKRNTLKIIINELQDPRSIQKNQWHFFMLAINNLKMKLRKQYHLQ